MLAMPQFANIETSPQARSAGLDLASDFRQAMRGLAATVSVITACNGSEPIGMTATSVSSLSLEPASLLVCVNRSASFYRGLIGARRFCVNILSTGDAELCDRFSGKTPRDERFSRGDWKKTADGTPYLASAQSSIVCRSDSQIDYGTHTIFIGLVEQVHLRDDTEPLIYHGGRLASLAPIAVPA